jgi:hypothetical protein
MAIDESNSSLEDAVRGSTRRTVLRGASVLLASGAASAYLLTEGVRPVLAVSNPAATVNDAPVIQTSDGALSDVQIEDANGIDLAWEDFDSGAHPVTLSVEVKLSADPVGNYEEVLSGSVNTTTATTGSNNYSFSSAFGQSSVSIISTTANIAASDFTAPTDGATETTSIDVKFVAEATVGGTPVSAENEASGVVTVENLAGDIGVGGDVNLTASE